MKSSNKVYFFAILLLIVLEPYTYISMLKIPQGVSLMLKLSALFFGYMFFVFARRGKIVGISVNKHVVMLLFIVSLLINKLITSDGSSFYFMLIMNIGIAYLASGLLEFEKFKESYVKVMSFLCVFSLVTTYVILFFTDFFRWLPTIEFYTGQYTMKFIDAGLSFIYTPEYGEQFRNYSLFREPGVFQFYIIIALIFELWMNKEKPKKSRVVIFSLALISTFSTTGIIIGLIILMIEAWRSMKTIKSIPRNIAIFFMCMAGFILLYYNVPFFKQSIMDSFGKLSDSGASTMSRTGSLRAYFTAWLQKPFLGWGYTAGVFEAGELYLSEYTKDNTNTTFTNLAFFGLIYGLLYQFYLIKFAFLTNKSWKIKLIAACLIILCINSQRFIESTLIFMLIFYTATEKVNNREVAKEKLKNNFIPKEVVSN